MQRSVNFYVLTCESKKVRIKDWIGTKFCILKAVSVGRQLGLFLGQPVYDVGCNKWHCGTVFLPQPSFDHCFVLTCQPQHPNQGVVQ